MTDSRWQKTRWAISRLGRHPETRPRPARWRSYDLRGPLPARVVRALETAIKNLPARGPWPEIDEEARWADVLTDRRSRTPLAKKLSEKNLNAGLRLDRCPAKSLTFSCTRCGESVTVKTSELIRTFGPDRNVHTIGRDVIGCEDKRARREGDECPITYRA
jgi:hypothetical protein